MIEILRRSRRIVFPGHSTIKREVILVPKTEQDGGRHILGGGGLLVREQWFRAQIFVLASPLGVVHRDLKPGSIMLTASFHGLTGTNSPRTNAPKLPSGMC